MSAAGAGSCTSPARTGTARGRRARRHQQLREPRLRPHAPRGTPDRRPGPRPRDRRGRGARPRAPRPRGGQAADRPARGGRGRRGAVGARVRVDHRLVPVRRRRLDRPMNPEVSVSQQPRTNIVRVVAASMAGTTVEWYDFFLYGVAAALVFPHVFFPTGNATAATLASLGTFAVGFLAQAIGVLASYATVGVLAPILLVVLRLIQGFALGGEWGGAVLIVCEHGDPARRGFWASWPQAGAPGGQLLANGLLFVLSATQSKEDFVAWGWRIPFLRSAVLVLIGLYVRLAVEESPVF